MFTGIVQALGRVRRNDGARLIVENPFKRLRLGDSVCVNGVCLTAARKPGRELCFDLSPETLKRTSLRRLSAGDRVNLEPSLRLGDSIGGHLLSGHVDAVARVTLNEHIQDGCARLRVELPKTLRPLVAVKGSIGIDGVSLTVTAKRPGDFETVLVPRTLKATNLASKHAGNFVNLEADVLARYVQNALQE